MTLRHFLALNAALFSIAHCAMFGGGGSMGMANMGGMYGGGTYGGSTYGGGTYGGSTYGGGTYGGGTYGGGVMGPNTMAGYNGIYPGVAPGASYNMGPRGPFAATDLHRYQTQVMNMFHNSRILVTPLNYLPTNVTGMEDFLTNIRGRREQLEANDVTREQKEQLNKLISEDEAQVASVYRAQMFAMGMGIDPTQIMVTLRGLKKAEQGSTYIYGTLAAAWLSNEVEPFLVKSLELAPLTREERMVGYFAGQGMLMGITDSLQVVDQVKEPQRFSTIAFKLMEAGKHGGTKGMIAAAVAYGMTSLVQSFGWKMVGLLAASLPPTLVAAAGFTALIGIFTIAQTGLLGYLWRPLKKIAMWFIQTTVKMGKCALWYTYKDERQRLIDAEQRLADLVRTDEFLMESKLGQYGEIKNNLKSVDTIQELLDRIIKCKRSFDSVCMYLAIKRLTQMVREGLIFTGDPANDERLRRDIITAVNEPKLSPSFLNMLFRLPEFQNHLVATLALHTGDHILSQMADHVFSLARIDPLTLLAAQVHLARVKRWDIPRQKLSCIFFRLLSPEMKADCGGSTLAELWTRHPDFPKALDKVVYHSRILAKLQTILDTHGDAERQRVEAESLQSPGSGVQGKGVTSLFSSEKSQAHPQLEMINILRQLVMSHPEFIVEKRLYYLLELTLRTGTVNEKRVAGKNIYDSDPILLGVYLQWARPDPREFPWFFDDYDMRNLTEIYRMARSKPQNYDLVTVQKNFFDADKQTFLPDLKIWNQLTLYGRDALLDLIINLYFGQPPAAIFAKRPVVAAKSFSQALWRRIKDYQDSVEQAGKVAMVTFTENPDEAGKVATENPTAGSEKDGLEEERKAKDADLREEIVGLHQALDDIGSPMPEHHMPDESFLQQDTSNLGGGHDGRGVGELGVGGMGGAVPNQQYFY